MNQARNKNFIDHLISKKGIFTILLFIIFILFFDSILDFYNRTVVNQLLSKIKSNWIIDSLFCILTILTLISTWYLSKINKRISNIIFFTILFFFCLLFYFRFSSREYTFQHFYAFNFLFYSDYLFLLFICIAFIKILNWKNIHKSPSYKDSPFLIDKPIEISSDDKFSRKIFAQKIANKIQSKLKVEKAGSLAIGINGAWGSGKTSFTNMIKETLDLSNRIVIDFNPWRSTTSKKIIEDFFELLIKEIKPFDPSLSNKIADYARTLTKIEENIITKSIGVITDFLFDEKSKNEAYESINASIEKIKKQIIIFIDDLDRLDKKEIIEVLRVIRNTANFNSVVYIVSYDKGYIQTAIKDFNKYNYKSFLEKIFQFEFTLPMYEHGVLRTEIKRLLKAELKVKFTSEIERVVDSKEYFGMNFTNEIVKTYRDVIRLVNSLLFEIETVQDDVFFYDFYLLQLLKLKYPKVYESLVEYRYTFFTKKDDTDVYRLKTEKEAWTSDDDILRIAFPNNERRNQTEENKITAFEKYLQDNSSKLGINDNDNQIIKSMIDTLLTLKDSKNNGGGFFSNLDPKYEEQDIQLYKSFAYPENFHKYFAFKLYEGDISANEFEDYRRREITEYKKIVLQWIKEGKYSVLIDRLEKIEDFITVTEFENQILILLEIGKYQLRENTTNPYWLDYSLILKNIEYPCKTNDKPTPYKSIEEYKKFLVETFENADKPPVYESNVISRLIAGRVNTPLAMDELSAINLNYFQDYCKNHNEITQDFRLLHTNAVRATNDHGKNYEVIPEAQELFKQYFLKNLKGCELSGFIKHTNPDSDYFNIDTEWVKTFFPDNVWQDIENYFETAENIKNESECYTEFMKFYSLFKGNEYKPVEFLFNYLKPNLWTGGTKSNPSKS